MKKASSSDSVPSRVIVGLPGYILETPNLASAVPKFVLQKVGMGLDVLDLAKLYRYSDSLTKTDQPWVVRLAAEETLMGFSIGILLTLQQPAIVEGFAKG